MIRKIKNWLRNQFTSSPQGEVVLPTIEPEDLFLVSYPKSGNTWMRFIFANLIRPENTEPVNFLSLWDYVPEFEFKTEHLKPAPRPRIIKSHSLYKSEFPYVIYIIRDPRDTYISYYHYLHKSLPEGMTFSDFIRTDGIRMFEWDEHVESWANQENLITIRYEDLLEDGVDEIMRVNELWPHRKFTREKVVIALEDSSLEKMRSSEKEYGHIKLEGGEHTFNQTFLRRGKSKVWQDEMEESDVQFLNQKFEKIMTRFGYK